ncbi:MAG: rhodanese-like domain-containing protein, partial [Chloroflexota bacterium]
DVQEMLKQNNIETVYTLPLEAYGGKYITGTSCKPSQTLTDEAYMTIASDEVLAEQLKDESQKDRIVTYCGGGIAATVNAVAHLIAGNENVSVYDGSLSEWMGEGLPISITDESA